MLEGVSIEVSAAGCDWLERLVADRNSPQKHVWRAAIILVTGEDFGMAEIMRCTSVVKLSGWRRQRRYMEAGVNGLLCDKTRKPGRPPLPPATVN